MSSKKHSPDKFENSRRLKTLSYFDEVKKISSQNLTSGGMEFIATNSSELRKEHPHYFFGLEKPQKENWNCNTSHSYLTSNNPARSNSQNIHI